jgi:hypothetical protein
MYICFQVLLCVLTEAIPLFLGRVRRSPPPSLSMKKCTCLFQYSDPSAVTKLPAVLPTPKTKTLLVFIALLALPRPSHLRGVSHQLYFQILLIYFSNIGGPGSPSIEQGLQVEFILFMRSNMLYIQREEAVCFRGRR